MFVLYIALLLVLLFAVAIYIPVDIAGAFSVFGLGLSHKALVFMQSMLCAI